MSFVFAAQKAETSRLLCKYGCVSNISSRIDWRIFALRLQLPYFISRIGDAMLTVTNGRWSKTGN